MPAFRKKPVVIEAVQFLEYRLAVDEIRFDAVTLPLWITEALLKPAGEQGAIWSNGNRHILVGTLESPHEANPGDWIIRGVKGELYPCKPDIFAATYDAVEA